jgi:hypothetical protein
MHTIGVENNSITRFFMIKSLLKTLSLEFCTNRARPLSGDEG